MRFTAHVLSGDSRYKINDQRRILIYFHHFEGRPVEVRVDSDIDDFLARKALIVTGGRPTIHVPRLRTWIWPDSGLS